MSYHDHGHDHGHDDHGHDPGIATLAQVGMLLLQAPGGGEAGIAAALDEATRLFNVPATPLAPGGLIEPGQRLVLELGEHAHFALAVPKAGQWLLFCEHAPVEFGLQLASGALMAQREYGSHHHDHEIGSIGIEDPRALDANKVNDWLSYLLQSRGQDILRMKGVLSFKDEPRRYVFHGVHMIFDGEIARPWGTAARVNRLVFIGRNLDRKELEAGFESCVA